MLATVGCGVGRWECEASSRAYSSSAIRVAVTRPIIHPCQLLAACALVVCARAYTDALSACVRTHHTMRTAVVPHSSQYTQAIAITPPYLPSSPLTATLASSARLVCVTFTC